MSDALTDLEWQLAQFARVMIDLLLLPPGCIVVLMLAGLLMLHRWARLARTLLWIAAAALLLLSMPVAADWLTRSTGDFAPLQLSAAARARAIVVLAAEERDAEEYGGHTVGESTLERVRFAAHLARASGLPLLLAGGRFEPGDRESLAQMMQRVLGEEYGVAATWLESESQDTRQNAERSAAILSAARIDTVVLVTHYAHMRRAVDNFTQRGITVIAAPVHIPPRSYRTAFAALWPRVRSLEDSALALHELLALAGRRIGVMT